MEEFRQAVSVMRRKYLQFWHDGQIEPGERWRRSIFEHLNSADIITLLVSQSFLDSDFCYEKEMRLALEREKRKEALVVPIIVRDCDWKEAPFADLQAIPDGSKAVTSWRNRDEAWTNVAVSLKKVVREVLRRKLVILAVRETAAALEARSEDKTKTTPSLLVDRDRLKPQAAPETSPGPKEPQSHIAGDTAESAADAAAAKAIYEQIARDFAAHREERRRIQAELQAKILDLDEELGPRPLPYKSAKAAIDNMDKYLKDL